MKVNFFDLTAPCYDKVTCDVLEHRHTHYWFAGGRGSAKSSDISLLLPVLILKNPLVHALICRKVGGTLKDSVYSQVVWAIERLELAEYFKFTKSPLEITYKPTGQTIYFRGADDPIKLKSIKPPFGYIGVVWFEELDQFGGMEEIRSILQSANRGGNKYWNFYSFNPPKSRDNWTNVAIEEEREDKLVTRTTYLDIPVEWLGEQFITEAEILKQLNPSAYEHEYLGIATGTGGDIFENVEVREITEEELSTFGYFYYGVDFGFGTDPFVWLQLSYDKVRKTLYFVDEIYSPKMSNEMIVSEIEKKAGKAHLITADSAEPRTIAELCGKGLRIVGAKKGPDSVDYGIKWLQDLTAIVIDRKRTPNAAREFSNYEYPTDKLGNFISQYPDKNNHTIDACRYALESEIGQRKIKAVSKSGIY